MHGPTSLSLDTLTGPLTGLVLAVRFVVQNEFLIDLVCFLFICDGQMLFLSGDLVFKK